MDGVGHFRVSHALHFLKNWSGDQCTGSIVSEALSGRNSDGVVRPTEPFGPRKGEIKVMPSAPWQWFRTQVEQREFTDEAERLESIAHGKLVIVRIGRTCFDVGQKEGGEAFGVNLRDFEILRARLTLQALQPVTLDFVA